jgi:hypothetical protein
MQGPLVILRPTCAHGIDTGESRPSSEEATVAIQPPHAHVSDAGSLTPASTFPFSEMTLLSLRQGVRVALSSSTTLTMAVSRYVGLS